MIRFPARCAFWLLVVTWVVMGALALADVTPVSADSPDILTLSEAAAMLRVTPEELETLAKQRCVPGRPIGAHWRFSRPALIHWLASTETSPDCAIPTKTASGHASPSGAPQASRQPRSPLPASELSRHTGRGTASTLAQATPTPSAAKPPETVGEKPDLGTAEEIALRGQRVLLQPRQLTAELGLFYTKSEQRDLTLVPSGGILLPTLANVEQDSFISSFTVRAGVFRDTQLFTSFSLLHQKDTIAIGVQEDSEARTDTGDVIVGARHTLFREGLHTPEVITSVEGRLPTNESSYAVGGGISLVKTIDPVVLFGSFNYVRTFSRDFDNLVRLQPEDTFSATLGYAVALNDRLSLTLSVSGVFTGESKFVKATLHSHERFTLQLGLTSLLTEKLYIEPTVSFGLNGPGDTVTIGVSLPYTFGL